MRELKKVILKTLAYADIFEYPLRKGEIWKYLITRNKPDGLKNSKPVGLDQFENGLEKLMSRGLIKLKNGYYFLSGRKEIVGLRKKREEWSREKMKKAKKVTGLLKIIPTVKLVGISGALAMGNADEGDDIDLFIITSARRLWLTRFLVTVLVELTGQRRRPLKPNLTHEVGESRRNVGRKTSGVGEEALRDKICLNMFLDENYLTILPKERNLFTAHEVVQMKPLWSRDGTYQRFLGENEWVRRWLSNSLRDTKHPPAIAWRRSNWRAGETRDTKNKPFLLLYPFLNSLEKTLMNLQLKYMEKRRTTEKISPGRILFHPEDKGKWVMREYGKKIANIDE